MANTIILKKSSVAASVPAAASLQPGELAVNLADAKLYTKRTDGTVILVGSGAAGGGSGTVTSVALSGGTTGLTVTGSPITTSGTITLGGTLAVGSGGTGLTSYTSGALVYASGTSTLAGLAAGTAKQVLTSSGSAPQYATLDMTYIPDAVFKKSVKVATTANITLSGAQTIDGVSVVAGDRVLVKDQTTTSQNGIYEVSASSWTRAADADSASEIAAAIVAVDQGNTNGGLTFDTDFKSTDTLGTTAMAWYRMVDTGSTIYVGTTAITLGRASAAQGLTGISTLSSTTTLGLSSAAGSNLTLSVGTNERLRLNSGHNVLSLAGVAAASWDTTTVPMAGVQARSASFVGTDDSVTVANNLYFNSTWKYVVDGTAAIYQQNGSTHTWNSYASGLANGTTSSLGYMNFYAGKLTVSKSLNLPHITAPASPVNGDIWTTTTGLYAQINGTTVGPMGSGGGGASVTVSDTAPASPTANSLWWDSNNGVLKIYYNDGTSSQWVDAVSSVSGAESDPTVPSHVKSITSTDISNWGSAYSWGNHALEGYASLESPSFTGTATFTAAKGAVVPVAASAINCASGNFFTKTATGALTWTITNVPSTGAFSFLLELTNGGIGTQTWFSGIKWPGGIAPTLTSAGVDLLGFVTDDGGVNWRGVLLMKDSK